MRDLLEKTNIIIEKWPIFGKIHILLLIGVIILALIISNLLKNKTKKEIKWILFGIGIFMMINECYNQLFHYHIICNGHIAYWIFPFQLCAVPMYLCILLPFIKKESIEKAILIFLTSYNFLGGFMALLYPSGVFSTHLFIALSSIIWHSLLVIIGFTIVRNKNIKFEKKDFKYAIILFIILCIIAFSINLILWEPSGHDINMFFIGPQNSNLIVFSTISQKLGWYINTPIYTSLLTLGAYSIFRLIRRLKNK